MTQTWDAAGARLPITILSTPKQVVSYLKTTDSDGYQAVQLAIGDKKATRINKPQSGHLKKLESVHPEYLREIRINDEIDLKLGDVISPSTILTAGDFVQVTGTSKGKGFAGVVKRHNFKGGPRTHGQSDRLRAPGSIGQGTDPGRVWPGKRMAGHMGDVTKTTTNLTVVKISDNEIWLKGLVPGPIGGLIKITKIGTNSKFPGLRVSDQPQATKDLQPEAADTTPVSVSDTPEPTSQVKSPEPSASKNQTSAPTSPEVSKE